MVSSTSNSFSGIRQSLLFILKDLVRDGWRTFITILNLMVFLCCYFCLAALARAAQEYGSQSTDRSSLMVVSTNVFDPRDSRLTAEQFAPLQELMPDKIQAVSPLIFDLLKVDSYLVQVRAAPQEDFSTVYRLELTDGSWPASAAEVVIGTGAVALAGWQIGQELKIFGRDFTISGVVSSPGTKSSSVWMDLAAAEDLFGTSGVYQFAWANVTPGMDAEEVRAILQSDERLAGKYDVYFVDHLYEQYSSALSDVVGVSSVLVLLSLLLVMYGTYGSIFLTLSERARDLTILRAVGFASKDIRAILSVRTMVQIIIAIAISWPVSALILELVSRKFPLIAHAIILDVVITPGIFLLGLLLALLFGWVGVLLPMLRISSTTINSTVTR